MSAYFGELIERFRDLQYRYSSSRRKAGLPIDAPRPCKLRAFDPSRKSYTRRPRRSEPDWGLCERCNAIDFLEIFCVDSNRFKGGGGTSRIASWFLPPLLTIARPQEPGILPTCPLCRLFHSGAIESVNTIRDEGRQLHITSRKECVSTNFSRNSIEVFVSTESMRLNEVLVIAPIKWHARSPTLMPLFTPRTEYLLSEPIDYSLFASEIQRCISIETEDMHMNAKPRFPDGMKMIDCGLLKVVDYDGGADYLTLSYVWGILADDAELLSTREDIRISTVPRTVRDAITVVLGLGKKYLWVDRYCIDQKDELVKASQINNMSTIFSRSWATMVSLGTDANTNLPGVTTPRQKFEVVRTAQCDILGQTSPPEVCVRSSAWNTRGWTFQEAVLSRRLLLFAASEVLLVCQHGVIYESLDGFAHSDVPKSMELSPTSSSYIIHDAKGQLFGEKSSHPGIEEYCSRTLSYDEDSLNAFRGYLNECGHISFWGVLAPLPHQVWKCVYPKRPHHLNNGICLGMLWSKALSEPAKSTKLCRVRVSACISDRFPSRSWISCRQNTKTLGRGFSLNSRASYLASGFLESPDGSIVPLAGAIPLDGTSTVSEDTHCIPENSKQVLIQGRLLDCATEHHTAPAQRVFRRWKIPSAFLDSDVALNAVYYPDQRTCCSVHRDWETNATIDQAVLLFVDAGVSFTEFSAAAYWLALHEENKGSHTQGGNRSWRRVGLIKASFAKTYEYSGKQEHEEGKSAAGALHTTFLKALLEAIKGEGNEQMLRLV